MMVALNVVIVAVSSLLHGQIIPLGDVRIVAPLNHAVKHIRHAGCLPACVDRLVADHLDIGDLAGQLLIRIPAGKYGAERALRATVFVGSRFALFFDYYAHFFYYKLCIINHSFYLSHKIYLVFYV